MRVGAEARQLEVLDAVPGDHLARRLCQRVIEHGGSQLVVGTLLVADLGERGAAAHRVVCEGQRLGLLDRAARLAQAVACQIRRSSRSLS